MNKALLNRLKRDVPGPHGGGDPGNPHNFVQAPSAPEPGTSQVFAGEGQLFQNAEAKKATFSPEHPRNPHLFVEDPQKSGGHEGVPSEKVGPMTPSLSENMGGAGEKVGTFGGVSEKKLGVMAPLSEGFGSTQRAIAQDVPDLETPGTDMWGAAVALLRKHLKVEAMLAKGTQLGPNAWRAYEEQILRPMWLLQDRMPNHQTWELNNYLDPTRGGPGFESALKAWCGLGGVAPGTWAHPLLPVLIRSFDYMKIRRLWTSIQKLAYASTESAARAQGAALKAMLTDMLRSPTPDPGLLERIDSGTLPGFEREVPCR